ncbi:heparan-alpha-glucosaminide N-acetyltransferase domain-containing protein [Reichenbachiella versicolor]|uniref:heparan-alpha-glucosaminide N-acetyltransferase domain-containing protein n=1 Tax=Reichenbachiella versicolor TaxID=1821036 RepID=UPI000D6DCDAD|nr:heparan-alpha-glucosaminide N-acetyltransferase domain-containing protein [Reichenbachiella versicolor]
MENKKRIKAIDMARGISVFMMIPVHSMMIYSDINTWETSWLGKLIQIAERGSPMFLVIMGISFAFSSKSDFLSASIRGLKLAAFGYILNILRFVIPLSMGLFPDNYLQAGGFENGSFELYKHYFLLGDILQLAGFTLILISLIQLLSKNKYVILGLALLMVVVSKELSGYRLGIVGLNYVTDILWGNEFNVYFPMFPWSAFVMIGLFFGICYREVGSPEKMYGQMLIYSALLVTVGGFLYITNYDYHFADYYHMGPGGFLLLMGLNIFLVWIGHVLVKYIPHNRLYDLFYFNSREVTGYYFIQWILINWGMYFFGFSSQGTTGCLAIIICLTICTIVILKIKNWFKSKRYLASGASTDIKPSYT